MNKQEQENWQEKKVLSTHALHSWNLWVTTIITAFRALYITKEVPPMNYLTKLSLFETEPR